MCSKEMANNIMVASKSNAQVCDVSPFARRRRRSSCGRVGRSSCFKIFLITFALCTSSTLALMCSPQHRNRYVQSSAFKSIRGNYENLSKRRQSLWAGKDSDETWDEEEDENDDYEDDSESNQYLESLISSAMEEEGLKSNTPQKSEAAASANNVEKDSTLEETKRMMEQQQQQIDLLMKMIQNQQQQPSQSAAPSKSVQTKSVNVTPLKIMFFIDGTWLYYSLHARKGDRCAATLKFGKGWQANYKVDWLALPRLICNEIDKQRGGKISFKGSDRPLDISRVSVFTSAKKDTDPNSIRMRMFRDMATANYDVHMMETIGKGEKCVDIQLAVEMLHYATVPNAFDMAVILTGDKDFVPALVRTRQKGKEVVICSMKAGCNRVLYESPHIRDYDVVWLENILDQFIIPIPEHERSKLNRAEYASAFTMMRVLRDYIEAAPDGMEYVSSRDIGKYLKSVKIADSDMLDELKQTHGGLWHFLKDRAKHLFEVRIPADIDDHSFEVRVVENSDEILVNEFKRNQYFTKEEKTFLEKYVKPTKALYSHTEYTNEEDGLESIDQVAPMPDYSHMKVADLKEICREQNLPTSGKKADLVERLEKSYREYQTLAQVAAEKKRHEWKEAPKKSLTRMSHSNNVYSNTLPQLDVRQTKKIAGRDDPKVTAHLEALVKEYLTASGGAASSRDIGRYLAANSDSNKVHIYKSALAELKESYGSLLSFLHSRDLFDVNNKIPESQAKANGFPVKLLKVKR